MTYPVAHLHAVSPQELRAKMPWRMKTKSGVRSSTQRGHSRVTKDETLLKPVGFQSKGGTVKAKAIGTTSIISLCHGL